jgi:preprotein translocase subunit SecA
MGSFNDYLIESYSNRFNAIWFYIIENIQNNPSIRQIKEMTNVKQPNGKKTDIFIVSQDNRFIVDEKLKIYGYTVLDSETNQDEKSTNIRVKSEKIENKDLIRALEKAIFLRTTDMLWMDHIDSMQRLRENVAFSGYAQKDPLTEYKSEAFKMFNKMMGDITQNTINTLFKIDFETVVPKQIMINTENAETNKERESNKESGGEKTFAEKEKNYSASKKGKKIKRHRK